mgnify:CR=1 FL=1
MSFENHLDYELFIKDPTSILDECKSLNIKYISICKTYDFLDFKKFKVKKTKISN